MGGEFGNINGIGVNRIAKREGIFWSAMGSGTGGADGSSVYAIATSGTAVFVGGNLSGVGAVGSNLGKWDGTNWSGLGIGISATNYRPSTKALAAAAENVYVGGDFTLVGYSISNRISASRIAKWNGTWSTLGSGMNDSVEALVVSGNELFAGGRFTTAGGKPAMYVARAYLPELPELSIIETATNLMVFWPSPNTAGFSLEEGANVAGQVKWLPMTIPAIDDGTSKTVSLPTTNGTKLFRLRKP